MRRDLDWFVGWRPRIWAPTVRAVLGDPRRFVGRRILELGCRDGRMAAYFALHGATVVAVDIVPRFLDLAAATIGDLGVDQQVELSTYDGDPDELPGDFDFVFTKSVLVVMPIREAVPAIRRRLHRGGQYLACENLRLPRPLNSLRTYPQGIDSAGLDTIRHTFREVAVCRPRLVVAGITATA